MSNQSHQTSQRGFTLIEVMVVIIIIAIMSTLGITNYLTFMEENQVKGAAKEVQAFLQDVQNRAKMGDRGRGNCSTASGSGTSADTVLNKTFSGWRVDFSGGGVSARPTCCNTTAHPICDVNTMGNIFGEAENLALSAYMSVRSDAVPAAPLVFKPLYSNINLNGNSTITVTDTRDTNIRYCFTINVSGGIGKAEKC